MARSFSLDKAGGAGTDASDRNQKYIESSPEKSSLSVTSSLAA
ncbi:hypothetical protein LEP1GSC124_2035 [Leptospira interrogans serovar Pyrogenes str. 200701872]|uniref:Uncharacterized protein n=1 Tax=Leptospira interrogans serovar Pyrogenes str. 200701872 TaxID=1193029 RepID=M7A7D7_LEPIR|nr:hypothetical protein LEP1GSC124_2035 [Leptospira interrogans serovar Pyrogenes str. 200701872]